MLETEWMVILKELKDCFVPIIDDCSWNDFFIRDLSDLQRISIYRVQEVVENNSHPKQDWRST